jgi:hypothetical protein
LPQIFRAAHRPDTLVFAQFTRQLLLFQRRTPSLGILFVAESNLERTVELAFGHLAPCFITHDSVYRVLEWLSAREAPIPGQRQQHLSRSSCQREIHLVHRTQPSAPRLFQSLLADK